MTPFSEVPGTFPDEPEYRRGVYRQGSAAVESSKAKMARCKWRMGVRTDRRLEVQEETHREALLRAALRPPMQWASGRVRLSSDMASRGRPNSLISGCELDALPAAEG